MAVSTELKVRGDEAEERFKEWMDRHHIPYWYIRQDLKTFSPALKRIFEGKRPDYMVLLPNFGFILVDAKYKGINPTYSTVTFDIPEAGNHSNLQRHFGLHIWYAVSNEKVAYQTWYWMHVSKVLEIGKTVTRESKDGKRFFAIPISEFIQVADSDGLDRLFAKCLKD